MEYIKLPMSAVESVTGVSAKKNNLMVLWNSWNRIFNKSWTISIGVRSDDLSGHGKT